MESKHGMRVVLALVGGFTLLILLGVGYAKLPQEIRNCWEPEVPCMDLSGEQRTER